MVTPASATVLRIATRAAANDTYTPFFSYYFPILLLSIIIILANDSRATRKPLPCRGARLPIIPLPCIDEGYVSKTASTPQ